MSRSIADQLAALRLYPALMAELPTFGKVAALEAGRGFGHIEWTTAGPPIFFHVSGRREAKDRPLHVGDAVLFITGSDPRKPDNRRAVKWVRVQDLAWGPITPPQNQAALDECRREALSKMSLDAIWNILSADWYVELWSGRAPCAVRS